MFCVLIGLLIFENTISVPHGAHDDFFVVVALPLFLALIIIFALLGKKRGEKFTLRFTSFIFIASALLTTLLWIAVVSKLIIITNTIGEHPIVEVEGIVIERKHEDRNGGYVFIETNIFSKPIGVRVSTLTYNQCSEGQKFNIKMHLGNYGIPYW